MTNFERYREQILNLTQSGGIHLGMSDAVLVHCGELNSCEDCGFGDDIESCDAMFIKWLYEDDGTDCSPDAGKPKGGCEGCRYQGNHILNLPCCHCERAIIDCFEPKKKPKKTRQSEFLKMYPNARLNSKGILDIRPCNIDTSYSTDHCYFACGDECQSNYWLQEVEE